jgi:hypothetical protein
VTVYGKTRPKSPGKIRRKWGKVFLKKKKGCPYIMYELLSRKLIPMGSQRHAASFGTTPFKSMGFQYIEILAT